MLISAHNEEVGILDKLENTRALDYPSEKLAVIVASDASDDATEALVERAEKVQLVRSPTRVGKSACINLAIPFLQGDIVVFSDANATYELDALRYLVMHFQDPAVGYVVGSQRYRSRSGCAAEKSESLYSDFEAKIKQLESDANSTVGGDGAILAMRRSFIHPLDPADVSDLRLPLMAVAAGYRGVYEPRARCWEDSRDSFLGQWQRKVRIIHRSIWTVLRSRVVLNPLQAGWFAYQVICHKLMRWLSPIFLIIMFGCTVFLSARGHRFFLAILIAMCCFLFLASLYAVRALRGLRCVYLPYYLVVMQCAAITAILTLHRPNRYNTWDTGRGIPKPQNGTSPQRSV